MAVATLGSPSGGALRYQFCRHAETRLAAAEAIARQKPDWAAYSLLDAPDDPNLITRQLAQLRLKEEFDTDLEESVGYRFYMTAKERRQPLARDRAALLKKVR